MILVFCELKDGQIRKPSAEALSEGRRLADAAGRKLGALFAGAFCSGAAEAAKYGADVILTAEGASLTSYSSDAYATVIAEAMKAKGATVLLAAATAVGKDVAPRAAARLGAGYASDVTGLSMVDGKLQALRPVYAGKAFATTSFASAVQVATTRPNVFAAAEKAGAGTMETLTAPAGDFKSVVKEILAKASGKVDLAEANVIVSGGRGMKDGANFKILEELADAIGGVVGASRAAVDAGWGLPQWRAGNTHAVDGAAPHAGTAERDGQVLTAQDEVLTYVARNLEPYRGYPSFIRALPKILAARPNLKVLICGGDDYEILCTVPESQIAEFRRSAALAGVPVSVIGVIRPGKSLPRFIDSEGQARVFERGSFSHF